MTATAEQIIVEEPVGIDAAHPKPGIYSGIAASVYHALPFCSASKLKKLWQKNAAQMKWDINNPNVTKEMLIGTVTHSAVWEPDTFEGMYTVAQQCAATTQKGTRCTFTGTRRSEGDWLCSTHSPKVFDHEDNIQIITEEIYRRATDTAAAILTHELAGKIVRAVPMDDRELTIIFRDEATGLWCKARLDGLIRTAGIIADLKTTGDASDKAFFFTAKKLGYMIGVEFYMRACRAVGIDVDKFCFIAAETEPAHGVAVYEPQGIDRWSLLGNELMAAYAECEKKQAWPGFEPVVRGLNILPE